MALEKRMSGTEAPDAKRLKIATSGGAIASPKNPVELRFSGGCSPTGVSSAGIREEDIFCSSVSPERGSSDGTTCTVRVPRPIVERLMTESNLSLLQDATGAAIERIPGAEEVQLSGTLDQKSACKKVLHRLVTHCSWGINEAKVGRLLSPQPLEAMLVRLSPMDSSLKPIEKALSVRSPMLTVGKDVTNDAVLVDDLASRQHCVLVLDAGIGAVYVADLSTNGTFLNRKRLPAKKQGKIMMCHGDELIFKDPSQDSQCQFGFVANLIGRFASSTTLPSPREGAGEEASGFDSVGSQPKAVVDPSPTFEY